MKRKVKVLAVTPSKTFKGKHDCLVEDLETGDRFTLINTTIGFKDPLAVPAKVNPDGTIDMCCDVVHVDK